MTKEQFFRTIARCVLHPDSSEEEVLSLMLLLHTHCIHLSPSIKLVDAGGSTSLQPLTRHSCADAVAAAFAADDKRNDHWYWFMTMNKKVPFCGTFEMPETWKDRLRVMIATLKSTDLVSDVREEE
jgi:hypothetical protein